MGNLLFRTSCQNVEVRLHVQCVLCIGLNSSFKSAKSVANGGDASSPEGDSNVPAAFFRH